ncbi:hypothetical protein EZV62_027967 [Acer yangbiense]|uniref:Secreted protein n=1 Tax=Acer yangbiense TaxID=1000413 RepID=A0A5C7GQE7_9ROSI|nr:hypothetical protein EZV62_027967 [Acer yangbiense]
MPQAHTPSPGRHGHALLLSFLGAVRAGVRCCAEGARAGAIDPTAEGDHEARAPVLPPDDKTGSVDFSRRRRQRTARVAAIRTLHRTIQSVGATGGVYKGQGRSQRELMTRAY